MTKIIKGANKKIRLFADVGTINSLNINLTPSKIGCKTPQKPSILGPRRRCIAPIILRSASVKYAIATNKKTIFISAISK